MSAARRMALPIVLLLAACGAPGEAPTPEPAALPALPPVNVAAYAGGTISLAEVEEELLRTRRPRDMAAAELVGLYRETAESLAVRRHALGNLGDPVRALQDRGEYRSLHRRAAVELFLRDSRPPEISADEARTFYDEHRERFRQKARRYAWHIYRRHRPPGGADEAVAFLAELKNRVAAGEAFTELARQYSDSETRLVDGRLGWIEHGRLPAALEEVLFGLREGEISDPVPGKAGSLLFYVSEAVDDKQYAFEDVRDQVTGLLDERRRRQPLVDAVADLEPPPGSLVLAPDELHRRLEAGDGEAVVLEVADLRLTVAEVSELAAATGEPVSGPRAEEIVEQQLQDQLLYLDLDASGWIDAHRGEIEDQLLAAATPVLVEDWIRQRLRGKAGAEKQALRSFYRDNSYLYQSPLRLKVWTLAVPVPAGGGRALLIEMEGLREELAAGRIDFAGAAQRLGTKAEDLGWLDFAQLQRIAPKIRSYLLDLGGTGYTVPFQQGNQLNVSWVEERQEPRQLPFEQVEDRILEDYLRRHQQRLYRELAAEILAESGFRFDEAAVRSALGLAEDAAGSSSR